MKQKKMRDILARLFETSKRDNGEEYIHFRTDVMDKASDAYPVYQAVSDAAYDSGLSHGFSYEISSRAADILAESEDWDNDDDIIEAVDSSCPIYTGEIMQVYISDSWAVDEAGEEYGNEGDSTKRAQMAWYMLIRNMVQSIRTNLEAI